MWSEAGSGSNSKHVGSHGGGRRVRGGDRTYLKVPSSDSIYDRTYHRGSLSSSASSSPLLPGQNVRSLTTLQQVNTPSTNLTGLGNYHSLYDDDDSLGVSRFRSASPLPSFKPKAFAGLSLHSSNQGGRGGGAYGYDEGGQMDSLVRHSDAHIEELQGEEENLHIRKLSIRRSHQDQDNLGFTIKAGGRGQSRLGGIYVHRVEKGSAADKAGLRRGDQILAANHLSFLDVSLDEALEVLNQNKTIHLTVLPPSPFQHLPLTMTQSSAAAANDAQVSRHYWVERSGRATSPPNAKYSHQEHVGKGQLSCDAGACYGSNGASPIGPTHDGLIHSPSSAHDDRSLFNRHSSRKKSKKANDAPPTLSSANSRGDQSEVRVMTFEVRQGECFGLTIKGGSEYGLGIFISAIERHSVAEKVGLQVGDQILSVNDVDFLNICHGEAAELLQHSPNMRVAIRRLSKLPPSFNDPSMPNNPLSPTNNGPLSNAAMQFTNYSSETNTNRLTRRGSSRVKNSLLSGAGGGGGGGLSGVVGDEQVVPDSQLQATQESEQSLLAERRVDAKAAQLLTRGELLTLSYYHNEYETKSMTIDAFVAVLLELLETPPKYTLMTEVRNLVRQEDLDKFDELIYRREVQAMKSKEAVKYVSDEMTDKTLSPSQKSPRSMSRKTRQQDDNRDFLMLGAENELNTTPSEDSGVDLANGGMPGNRPGQSALGFQSGVGAGSKLSLSRNDWKMDVAGASSSNSYTGPRHSFDLRSCVQGSRVMSAAEKRRTQLRRHSSGGEGGNHDDKRQNYGNGQQQSSGSWGTSSEERRWSIGSQVPQSEEYGPCNSNGLDELTLPRQDLPTVTFDERVHTREESPCMPAPLPVPIAVPSLMPPSLILSNEAGVSNVVPDSVMGPPPPTTRNESSLTEEESLSLDNNDLRRNDEAPWLQIPSPTHPQVRRHRSLPDPHGIGSPRGGGTRRNALDPSTYMSTSSHSAQPDNRQLALPPPQQQQQQLRSASLRNPGHRTVPEGSNIRVTIKKSRAILGIAIEGGANTTQPLPRIISIHASGAAFEAGGLKVGHVILEVDGVKMHRKRHEDAAKFIADSFYGNDRDQVEFLVTDKAKSLLDLRRSSCLLMD